MEMERKSEVFDNLAKKLTGALKSGNNFWEMKDNVGNLGGRNLLGKTNSLSENGGFSIKKVISNNGDRGGVTQKIKRLVSIAGTHITLRLNVQLGSKRKKSG